jgi:hypothetical protein
MERVRSLVYPDLSCADPDLFDCRHYSFKNTDAIALVAREDDAGEKGLSVWRNMIDQALPAHH